VIIILALVLSVTTISWVKYSDSLSRHKFLDKIVQNYKDSRLES